MAQEVANAPEIGSAGSVTWGFRYARSAALAALTCAVLPGALRAEAAVDVVGSAATSAMAGAKAGQAAGAATAPQADTLGAGAPAGSGVTRGETTGENAMIRTSLTTPESEAAQGDGRDRPIPAITRPKMRNEAVPAMRWAHRPEDRLWTRAALSALKDHGRPLVTMVPGDIQNWCPAYAQAGPDQRSAFWVGFMSALAKHESTYRPEAVGGGGLWYGLLQILPSTARLYDCRARSGAALKNGAANLSCGIRIMAVTVPRDGVIHAYTKSKKRRWRGVSADWGPMRSKKKRADMAAWLRKQDYCRPLASKRPVVRPEGLVPG